jgi:TRAP transporter 4TM/12TM fusion protein
MTFAFVVTLMCVIGFAVYYGIGWIKDLAGGAAIYIVAVLVAAAYVGLLWFATRYPELEMDDPDNPVMELPETGPTVKAGLYFLLPIVVLMWCLIVERFSPGLSAFWATVLMIIIVLTQRPLLAIFRGRSTQGQIARGWTECIDGLGHGGRNMIGIGVATAAAGIIVGTITLTGIGQVMIEFVEFISGGNLLAALIFTAMICIILGMGLPTTANYIVVSSLMAPVVVSLAASNGLIVPLIAVHMFVFYFGILADDTPPVGLAAFAAAAIAKSDPIRTGIQGFAYDIRTAILPFLFIFNTELLLIGIENWFHLVGVIVSATIAMLLFAAATQGYWLVKSRIWESLAILLIAFTLFRPGFWWDEIYPPTETLPASQIVERAAVLPENGKLRMMVQGETLDGKFVEKLVRLPLGKPGDGESRLREAGLEIRTEDGKVLADNVMFGSDAQKVGLDFDWEIVNLQVDADIPPKHIMFIPALALLGLIAWLQLRRKEPQTPATQTA